MAVSAGDLDALVGLTLPPTDFYDTVVTAVSASYNPNGGAAPFSLSSTTVQTTGAFAFPTTSGIGNATVTVRIAAVSDSTGAITTVSYINGMQLTQFTYYAIAFSQGGILISPDPYNSTVNTLYSVSQSDATYTDLDVIYQGNIPADTSLTFTPSGSYSNVTTNSGTATIVGGATDTPGNGGADTVIAPTGNNTVTSGTNGAFVFLGSGANSVTSGGADTVVGGTGSATVSPGSNNDLVFSLGGPLAFIAGTGASTVVSGTVATTLFGGASGGTLMFGDGQTDYIGGGATDTVVGLNGSLTAQGGASGGVFFGGTAGNNMITAGAGSVTALGGGTADVLTATGNGTDLFAGGVGAETLTGAGSTGQNTFFAGFGPETLIGGAGNTALVAGAGLDLLEGGSGLTLFLFVAGRTNGAGDTITGFDPSHDFVKLLGYSGSEASIVANATVSAGSATIALPDGTNVTFAGVTHLNLSSFN